ncbi:hypothetical protein RI367_000311 [Sorochytrium milnesiophthora]
MYDHTHYTVPHIPGLLVLPRLLPVDAQQALLDGVANTFAATQNQAMLFGRLPAFLDTLIAQTAGYLPQRAAHEPLLDQLIMNRYEPGDGIALHVDLLKFDDGVLVASLQSGLVMDFVRCGAQPCHDDDDDDDDDAVHQVDHDLLREQLDIGPLDTVLVPAGDVVPFVHRSLHHTQLRLAPGSVVVLQGEARYGWRHGIAARAADPWWRVRCPAAEVAPPQSAVPTAAPSTGGIAALEWDGVLDAVDQQRVDKIVLGRGQRTSITLRKLSRNVVLDVVAKGR